MPESITQSPGTVSKILWHFTGGPLWNDVEKRQNREPKPAKQAYKNLKAILQSKELRIGRYKEVVKSTIPKLKKYNRDTKKWEVHENVLKELVSAPVCCLADIPIAHLSYHAHRYGKFAIGFHRTSVLKHGFNPVLYTLVTTEVIRTIFRGLSGLDFVDLDDITSLAMDLQSHIDEYDSDNLDLGGQIFQIESTADEIGNDVKNARKNFEKFLAFIKTFTDDEFSTIYCEREWRSIETFSFNYDDLAMIVVPKNVSNSNYFKKLTSIDANRLSLPRSIPIIPWEDLIEH